MKNGVTVGKVKEGINLLKDVLVKISKQGNALVINGENYLLLNIDESKYISAKDLGGWDEKYAEHIYDRDDLLDYEQEELVSKIPETSISLKDYFQNEVAQELYDAVIDTDYTGAPFYVLKFDMGKNQLYIKEVKFRK